jgi:hypothetical protein
MRKSIHLECLYSFVLLAYCQFDIDETARRLGITVHRLRSRLIALEKQIEVPLYVHNSTLPSGPLYRRKGHRGIDWTAVKLTRAGKKLMSSATGFMCNLSELEMDVRVEHHRNQIINDQQFAA